jgi:carbon-monoxide dehydrogenase small subunit
VKTDARKTVEIRLKVNGTWRDLRFEADKTLAMVLREDLGLTGTKVSCGQGECGCCTVVLDGRAANSCLVPAAGLDGQEVVTVEGLSEGGCLDPLQQAFIEKDAAQCGFCTPGMLMSAKALLMHNDSPGLEEIRYAIEGNYCRCTGYKSIVEAIQLAAQRYRYVAANPKKKPKGKS